MCGHMHTFLCACVSLARGVTTFIHKRTPQKNKKKPQTQEHLYTQMHIQYVCCCNLSAALCVLECVCVSQCGCISVYVAVSGCVLRRI